MKSLQFNVRYKRTTYFTSVVKVFIQKNSEKFVNSEDYSVLFIERSLNMTRIHVLPSGHPKWVTKWKVYTEQ